MALVVKDVNNRTQAGVYLLSSTVNEEFLAFLRTEFEVAVLSGGGFSCDGIILVDAKRFFYGSHHCRAKELMAVLQQQK